MRAAEGARGAASLMGARGAASLMSARSLAGRRHAAVAAITVPARLYIDRSSLDLTNLSDYIN